MEQEQERIEPLKYQLKQWRKLVRYLPPADSDRNDVAEIEKLVKQGIAAQPAAQADKWVCQFCLLNNYDMKRTQCYRCHRPR